MDSFAARLCFVLFRYCSVRVYAQRKAKNVNLGANGAFWQLAVAKKSMPSCLKSIQTCGIIHIILLNLCDGGVCAVNERVRMNGK